MGYLPKYHLHTHSATTTYKCQASYFIVDAVAKFAEELAKDKQRKAIIIGNIGFIMDGVGTAIALSVVAAPFGVMIAITGMIWQKIQEVGEAWADELEELNDFLTANRDDAACILYNAPSTEQAYNDFLTYLSDNAISVFTRTAVGHLLNYTLLNTLFFEHPTIDVSSVGTVDCSGCGGESLYQLNSFNEAQVLVSGNFRENEQTTIASGVRNYFGDNRAGINVSVTPYGSPPINRRLRVVSIDNPSGNDFYVTLVRNGTPEPNEVYTPAELLAIDDELSDLQVTRAAVGNTSPFEITVVINAL